MNAKSTLLSITSSIGLPYLWATWPMKQKVVKLVKIDVKQFIVGSKMLDFTIFVVDLRAIE